MAQAAGSDWVVVARAALERDSRPVLVLDEDLRICFANTGAALVLGRAAGELVGGLFCELCVAPSDRTEVSRKLSAELQRSSTSELVSISSSGRDGEALTLSTEITSVPGQSRRFLLLVVLEVSRTRATDPPLLGRERYYEISSAPRADFGVLRRAWGEGTSGPVGRGERCFRAWHGRDVPCPDCPVLALGMDRQPQLAHSIMVRTDRSPALEIVRAKYVTMNSVAVSAFPVAEDVLSALLQKRIALLASRGGLSEREKLVLDLLLLGRSKENIASELQISPRTVKYHQRNIQRKLGAESRVDLARLIL